ncbi:O-antigen ligase family protein [Sulfitobacter aestuarii]|uniref:O-antigen ligase family protein n=1 Tax=Sulfitobacter aestuarii TaxID=2161676 RepID=A0ABW5U265_9RHOB
MVTMSNYATYQPSRNALQLRITAAQRDFWAFALWVLVTFVQFKNDELLLYPLALYFAYAIWRDQKQVLPLMARGWVVLLFALWCLISPIWAVEPMGAFKNALYLLLTILICFHVAAVLSARQIMHAVVFATGAIAVLSLYVGLTSGHLNLGVFPQKNTMGKSMVILFAAASATAMDSGSRPFLRLLAAALAILAAFLAAVSESATAVLLLLGVGGVVLLGKIIVSGGPQRASRLSLAFLFISALFFAASVVVPTLQENPVDQVLDKFGKDSTLTGRTLLWDFADEQIAERPFVGVGAEGFWRYNASPTVQMIFEEFHKRPGDAFNFHNSYYEIAVHQGLIGLTLAVVATLWAQGKLVAGAWRLATMPFVFFLAQSVAVLARTVTESDFLRPFVLFHMLFWIGALIVLKEGMHRQNDRS